MADDRGARLFTDLNSCFRRDPLIDEYDFLPVTEPKHNKSPLVVVEHKLGLEAWCVKILFRHCYDRLLAWRSKEGQAKHALPQEVAGLSRAVLLVQPDCYTAWNIRKELVENGELGIAEDLKFGALILTKYPKSPETFMHRRWLLQNLIDQCLASSNDSNTSNNSVDPPDVGVGVGVNVDAIGVNFLPSTDQSAANNHVLQLVVDQNIRRHLQDEMAVCARAAERYACNYHAWSHRIWTLYNCYNCSILVLLAELYSTQPWVSTHISDHSGFHYRQFLLTQLHQRSAAVSKKFSTSTRDLLETELQLVLDLINSYPGHEALWYHRKYVFHSLYHSLSKPVAISPPSPLSRSPGENGAAKCNEEFCASYSGERQGQKKFKSENNDQQGLVLREMDSISHKAMQNSNKHHKHLAVRYKEWILKCYSH